MHSQLWGVDSSQESNALPTFLSQSSPKERGEKWKKKITSFKLKTLFNNKSKNYTSKKNKILTHHFPLAGRCTATSWIAGTQRVYQLPRKTNSQPQVSSLLPSFPGLNMISHGMDYPFSQFGSAVLAMSTPKLLSNTSLHLGGWEWEM